MDQPTFEVRFVTQGTPFQRSETFGHFYRFSDGSGRAFVDPDVAEQLARRASAALPRETGGLLTGRVLHDSGGPYPIVVGFIEAPPEAGRSGRFHISAEMTNELRVEVIRNYPTADVIGWWHSHWGPSGYSDTDRDTQRMWTAPESVGLLVFAEGNRRNWGTVYLGPGSRRLSLASDSGPGLPVFGEKSVVLNGRRYPRGGPSRTEDRAPVAVRDEETPPRQEVETPPQEEVLDGEELASAARQPTQVAGEPSITSPVTSEEAREAPGSEGAAGVPVEAETEGPVEADAGPPVEAEVEQPVEADAGLPVEAGAEHPVQVDAGSPVEAGAESAVEAGEEDGPEPDDPEPAGDRGSTQRGRVLIGVFVISTFVALVVLAVSSTITAISVTHLSRSLNTSSAQIVSQLGRQQTANWNCALMAPGTPVGGRSSRSGQVADSFLCYLAAPVTGSASWFLNGKQIGVGSSIQVPVSAHGQSHDVLSLVITGATGPHSEGSLTLP